MPRSTEEIRNAALEEAAKVIEPKRERPCDCEPLGCYCGNSGDAAEVAMWDADTGNAAAIRELKTGGRS